MRRPHGIIQVVLVLACSLLLSAGCSQQRKGPLAVPQGSVAPEPDAAATAAGQAVTLTLTFTPGRTTTYRVTTEAAKSVEWHGDTSNKPAAFQGGSTGHHTEITFEQQVRHVDDQGNATLRITIKALKYLSRARDAVTLDFDSTRPADQDHPMARLIGLGYSLQMSPRGDVLAVTDVGPARQALPGSSPEQQTALRLLDEPIIRARHEIPALAALPDGEVSPGQRWSDIKSLDFGMLGTREFERIYTLREIETADADRLALIEMNAIPSSALAQSEHAQQQSNVFAQMFDSTESYDGRLELSLGTGEIVTYVEQLRMQWVAADPGAAEATAGPAVLRMGADQLYKLERVE